jgi:hypothetical protein
MNDIVIEITPELQAMLDEVPDSRVKRSRVWTREEDALLLAGWPVKNHAALSKKIGVSENTARYRFQFLMEVRNGN